MIKIKPQLKFGLLVLFGIVALLLSDAGVQAAVTVYDNTGSGTTGAVKFDNNNYTSTTGMTMKTGTASSGTSLSNESNVNISFGTVALTRITLIMLVLIARVLILAWMQLMLII